MFSLDSKFMQTLNRLSDLMILNLLFLLTCLPIITIGAANTALNTVCIRMDTEREGGLVRTYFRAFRDNFRQSTLLWLLLALCGTGCCFNILLFSVQSSPMHYAYIPFTALLVLIGMTFGYVFPLLSQFQNSIMGTLRNAVLLSIAYLPKSILITAVNFFPWILLYMNFYAFLKIGILWILLYFSAASYLNVRILSKVFSPFLEKEDEQS